MCLYLKMYKKLLGAKLMEQFVINENPLENGAYEIHNATQGCKNLPAAHAQILIGYFSHYELAQKRAKMNWPKEKVQPCPICC